ncbi:polysaccharide pyruvyl transferase family protein [Gramella sp. AN32]|uniref:Polysaccharide pyruvyl transferase family protein n=1 Tax=Christiangramia antarctica TaxID=2058158 RepID=A0ABW5X6S3_9FLAO|nr:polysaccharide pyruvyl transferase family protein [Gramella sp. AN32]
MGKHKENYGDLLSKYIVEKISEKQVKWVHPKKQPWYKLNNRNYLAAGSIIHHANKNSIIWGSGIIDFEQKVVNADFRAVRGPETRNYLINLGYDCPEVYGDPAILLPNFYIPQVKKKFKLGIIPHYTDYNQIIQLFSKNTEINIIDLMTNSIEKTTDEILSCEKIISSSLHGLIVPHAYGVPAVWIPFSNKPFGNAIKYKDYYNSVGCINYDAPVFKSNYQIEDFINLFNSLFNLPEKSKIVKLKEDLMASCPFVKITS